MLFDLEASCYVGSGLDEAKEVLSELLATINDIKPESIELLLEIVNGYQSAIDELKSINEQIIEQLTSQKTIDNKSENT